MANQIIIITKKGNKTQPMEQLQAENYLGNLINQNRVANLKQSLNDVTSGKGKATGEYKFDGHPVLHASSGKPDVKSVCLFYYDYNDDHYIIAMGEHTASKEYKLTDYGQKDGDFQKNKTIDLN